VLDNPTYGEGDPHAWAISDQVGGTPDLMDTFHPSSLRSGHRAGRREQRNVLFDNSGHQRRAILPPRGALARLSLVEGG
jgi:hypothetical protein